MEEVNSRHDREFYQIDGNSKKELHDNARKEYHFHGLNFDLPSLSQNLYVEALTPNLTLFTDRACPSRLIEP